MGGEIRGVSVFDTNSLTLISLLGAPPADKRAVLFDTAHDVSEQRADMIREVTAWLDRYLGKVR